MRDSGHNSTDRLLATEMRPHMLTEAGISSREIAEKTRETNGEYVGKKKKESQIEVYSISVKWKEKKL